MAPLLRTARVHRVVDANQGWCMVRESRSASAAQDTLCGSRTRRKHRTNSAASACGTRGLAPPSVHGPARPNPEAAHDPATAEAFAERTVRAALEVLDRRRSIRQLTALLSPDVYARLHTLAGGDLAPSRRLGPAVLVRIDVMLDGKNAEIVARYRRGHRYLALAGRISHSRRHGWRLTALRIG
ncbi:Rv3235 family protein [Nocardia cyriacigeorgica]|uniref:Rv3235 family protein n=1 Tax=Nocardia cyriacigeorgica TaxID=135487 RepID=UPI00189396D1|nr:Rv3235 family protein [Nocardia cyriacigeorgica]MBF6346374.1 hypothetical protein [Nocardia cyriacigeorgica]